jgi:hypothetical protein
MFTRISPSILLFLFCFSLYISTMSGVINYGDEMEKYRVAQSIVERGEFSFRPTAQKNAIGVGGRTFSGYELGQTLVEIPFYLLGKIAATVFPVPDSNALTMLFVGLTNPLTTALAVVLLFRTGELLGFRRQTALGLSMVFGLATIVFPYSRSFTREPLLTLLLLLNFYAALKFSTTHANRWLLFAGLASGYLVFTKFIHGVVIPVILIYLLVVIVQRERARGANRNTLINAALRGAFVFLLPGLTFLMIQMLYAFARFGRITSGLGGLERNPIDIILALIPLGNPPVAVAGLLFSLDKSVFLYSPPILLAIVAWFFWWRANRRDALLVLALIIAQWATVIFRPDWDGGTWWGPRYLVQITPLLILPIGFMLDALKEMGHKLAVLALSVLSVIGFLIQLVGAFVSDRDYLDTTSRMSTLLGQIDFLRYGALDSLIISLSPENFPIRINPFGLMLIGLAGLLAWGIIANLRRAEPAAPAVKTGLGFLIGVLILMLAAFGLWVVAPYPQIVSAKADTRYVAANNFLKSGHTCRALAYYQMAVERGTNYASPAIFQIDRLWQPAPGKNISLGNPALWIDSTGAANFKVDETSTLTGKGALKFSAPGEQDASIAITSEPITVLSNAPYELSGWLKSLSVYGTGYGVVSIFEDDGNWGKGKVTDLQAIDETSGWRRFRKTFTTLATTKRLFIKAGLHNTFGTLWVDGIQLTQIDPRASVSSAPLPPCK